MHLERLYAGHVERVARDADAALEVAARAGRACDGILFHAGSPTLYHADDQEVPFRPTPHFARWVPLAGPEHLLLYHPGSPPRLVRVVPRDYWYEAPAEPEHPYARVLDVQVAESPEAAARALGRLEGCAYVGNDAGAAARFGIQAVEPEPLVAALDWARGSKTDYEVACIREAGRIAARGHEAVRDGVAPRLSERQLHAAYLDATAMLEKDCPYTNIIAWDDRSAILHYQTKRSAAPDPGAVLLVDAGAVFHGYASDITRTYACDGAHTVFRGALERLQVMQRQLVAMVKPGQSYLAVHDAAHRGAADILCDLGILKVDATQAYERGLTRPFFPHGVGHHLGLQVHDVGGRQVSPRGERREPPPQHPFLRTTRDLDVGQVVTIEPGLYFIPMLLEAHRTGPNAAAFDWGLVDALIPCGGIRIEDDVLVTPAGPEDLTRPFLA